MDRAGNAYVAGGTASSDFLTTQGVLQRSLNGSARNAYVTVGTASTDFPTTPGALQHTLRASSDPFISKLNSTGTGQVYSTLLGGARDETGLDVVVDATGAAYVTGSTSSADFPTTPGALLNSGGCGFIAKITSGPPACAVLALLSGPPAQITATVHADRGLSSVVASSSVNTTVAFPILQREPPTPGSPPLKNQL